MTAKLGVQPTGSVHIGDLPTLRPSKESPMPRRKPRMSMPESVLDDLFHSLPAPHRTSRIRSANRAFGMGVQGSTHRMHAHHARQADFERLVRTRTAPRTTGPDARTTPQKTRLQSRARILAGLVP